MYKELERKIQVEIKRESFIEFHPPLQALLLSSYILLSSLLHDLQEMKKIKEEEEEQLT